jgi:hypothetical protein
MDVVASSMNTSRPLWPRAGLSSVTGRHLKIEWTGFPEPYLQC